MKPRTDLLPLSLLLALAFGLIPSGLAYHYVVPLLTPADGSLAYLWSTVWTGTWSLLGTAAQIDRYWPWLIQHHYGAYLGASVLASTLTGGLWVAVTRRQLTGPLYGVLGGLAGLAAGLVLTRCVELPIVWELPAPALAAILGSYVVTLFTALPLPEIEMQIVRGTRIVPTRTDTRKAVAKAVRTGKTCLAGELLPAEMEVRHILLLGASGTGKTAALIALVHTARARGDRMVVVDPDGAGLSRFFRPGDIILNPLDRRSVRWDMFAEIERPGDLELLAKSILPKTGHAENDKWQELAQGIFTAALGTWREEKFGTSDEFLRTMVLGGVPKLKLLCQGTAAAINFDEGGEKLLNSILTTLNAGLVPLVKLIRPDGELFSVREWMRNGKGSLFLPYGASQIPALAGAISCWMRLAINELLDWEESETRRFWFCLDELDALGEIDGLKDAMVRARRKGGCIVAGIQSIAQVKAVYGANAQTITEQFGSQLILKCGASESGGTAKFASELVGQREVGRTDTSISHNRGPGGPSTTTSYRTHLEQAVLPSEITQLRNLSGYLRIGDRPEWLKVSYKWIDLKAHTSPTEPIKFETEQQAGTSAPIDAGEEPGSSELAEVEANGSGQAVTPPLMSADGFLRMAFPWSAERVLDLAAELYCRQHPERPPAPSLLAGRDELAKQEAAYASAWLAIVWPDFRRWWTNAAEEDRYHLVMAALRSAGLDLAGYDAIPDGVWEQVLELRPTERPRAFLDAA